MLLFTPPKGGTMRRFLAYILVTLLLGGILAMGLTSNTSPAEKTSVTSVILDAFNVSETAYAQDTLEGGVPEPPPPIPSDP